MKFTIHHLLGIDSAEVDVGPGEIVEVVGPNASGKTSFAVVVQALAGRNVNPLSLSIGDARKVVPTQGRRGRLREGHVHRFRFGGMLSRLFWRSTPISNGLPRNATMTALHVRRIGRTAQSHRKRSGWLTSLVVRARKRERPCFSPSCFLRRKMCWTL